MLAVRPFADAAHRRALRAAAAVPPRTVDDQVFRTPEDALHGVFLKRVQDLMEILRADEGTREPWPTSALPATPTSSVGESPAGR